MPALAKFAARLPSLRASIRVLLKRSLLDDDDEVTNERGTGTDTSRLWLDIGAACTLLLNTNGSRTNFFELMGMGKIC